MKPFFALLNLSFKSLLINSVNIGRGKTKKSRSISGVGALVFLSVLCLYLSGTYSMLLGSAMGPLGGLDIMLGVMSIMALLWPLIFVLFAAQSLVFATKDIDLVLSLPVSSFSVMLARVLALYLETLLMLELMLVPAGVSYMLNGGANGVAVLITMLVQGVFLALVPTVLALLFGSLVALVVSRLPFKNLFTVVFSLLFVGVIMVGSFSASGMATTANAASLEGIRSGLFAFAPLGWMVQGMLGNVPMLLLCVALSVAPFFLVVWVFSHFYKGILTRLTSHRVRNDYKVRVLKSRGPFSALFAKEMRRFFGTPAYLLNGGITMLLLIVGSVAAVIYRDRVAEFLPQLFGVETGGLVPPFLLLAMCFMSSFSFVSCVSISLEGKTLWILKAAPTSTSQVFLAKWGGSFVFGAVCCVVCYPLLAYAFSLNVLHAVLMFVFNMLLSLFTSVFGLYVNLLLPRLDVENETMIIKQSASTMVAMLASFALVGLLAGLFFLVGTNFLVFLLVGTALLAVMNAVVFTLINTHGKRLFAQL